MQYQDNQVRGWDDLHSNDGGETHVRQRPPMMKEVLELGHPPIVESMMIDTMASERKSVQWKL